MNYILKAGLLSAVLVLMMTSCNNGPKVISSSVEEGSSNNEGGSTGIFSDTVSYANNKPGATKSGMHEVVVQEVLPTSKYVYMRVKEGEEEFWVATAKQEVEVGQTYFYKGGLLKTNFESKEYNRVFDKVYLVGKIVAANHSQTASSMGNIPQLKEEKGNSSEPRNIQKEGSVRIADLVANPEKYEGKTIQISGECTKVNPNIMGRNWMHLKDGSNDDYDLVITSDVAIPEGHVVTMTGKVVLNKDFGAGYKYDLILEEGKIVQ